LFKSLFFELEFHRMFFCRDMFSRQLPTALERKVTFFLSTARHQTIKQNCGRIVDIEFKGEDCKSYWFY